MADEADASASNRVALAIAPGVLLAGFAGGIAFPILPIVGARVGLPLPFIGVILAANRAARVVSSPIVGAFSDRYGGRRTLLVGLAIQVVVMLLYALGIETGRPGAFFLGGRLLHGPGSAAVFVAAQTLALHAGGKEHGGRAAGTVRGAMAIGVPLGLVVGGLLSDRIGNAHTFETATGVLVVATLVATVLVPDLRAAPGPRVPLLATVRALADRRLLAIGAVSFAGTFSASGMVLTTLVLLVAERRVSLLGLGEQGTSGALMGLMVVATALTMPLWGKVGDRRRAHGAVSAIGLVLIVVALVWVALAHRLFGLFGGLVLLGIGAGALGPSLLALLGALVPVERRGTAIGAMQLASDVGGMLGPLVGTTLLAGDVGIPYLGSAALVACFVPVALWLARTTRV